MSAGARMLAYDWVHTHLPPAPCRVLDVGAGDAPLAGELAARGYDVIAIDNNAERLHQPAGSYQRVLMNCARPDWPLPHQVFDIVIAIWSLQHLLGNEATAWRALRRLVVPDGRFLCVQRHTMTCQREMERPDPLNGYSVEGLRGLAQATGWRIEHLDLRTYNTSQWWAGVPPYEASAICAVLSVEAFA